MIACSECQTAMPVDEAVLHALRHQAADAMTAIDRITRISGSARYGRMTERERGCASLLAGPPRSAREPVRQVKARIDDTGANPLTQLVTAHGRAASADWFGNTFLFLGGRFAPSWRC